MPRELIDEEVPVKRLVDGYGRFRGEVYPAMESLYRSLAGGQQPEALFITCADSRIDPARLLQVDPGSIMVLRNAGNILPPEENPGGEWATVEFCVRLTGVHEIIVCGHSSCAAITRLAEGKNRGGPSALDRWLEQAAEAADVDDANDHAGCTIRRNVALQLERLTRNEIVQEAIYANRLRLHGWFYDIGEGTIEVLEGGSWRPLG